MRFLNLCTGFFEKDMCIRFPCVCVCLFLTRIHLRFLLVYEYAIYEYHVVVCEYSVSERVGVFEHILTLGTFEDDVPLPRWDM